MAWRRRALILFLVLVATPASAYPVGPAVPLEDLANKVDLVCKATVISDRAVVDPSFVKVTGYDVHETQLRVVSTFKGKPGKTIKFRHYHYAPKAGIGMGYSPLAYEIDKPGRSYLIFALAGKDGSFKQFQKDHTQKARQGVLVAADDKPHSGTTITEIAWAELRGALAHPDLAVEAIEELELMSGGRLSKLKDFDRKATLAELRPLVLSKHEAVATAAITAFGSDGPYFVERDAPYWLAGIGKGNIAGLSPRKPNPSPAAMLATKELLEVANTNPKLKALAIRALGRTSLPAATLAGWARDPDVAVRRAAVLVSAELADRTLINAAVSDKAPEVRIAAALGIGFSQDARLLRLLDKLLKDPEGKVRAAAAMSLLSFAIDQARPTMAANLTTDYRPLFLNELARKDPKPYLAQLGDVIEKMSQPAHWWGGSIPAGESWKLMFDYLKQQPVADLVAGKHDASLASLEKMKWFGSSEPTSLYALYVRAGMTARAKQFREFMKTAVSYAIDQYFDMADRNPTNYLQ
ncbi:MAG: HEAT repeat domain-containing protein [Deltaproteobacteria bacterium]|nr:HEAT repeat domain-containing protein [Deltaproteobacteria bacterium]